MPQRPLQRHLEDGANSIVDEDRAGARGHPFCDFASFKFDGASHGFDRDFLEIGELDTFLVEDGRATASDKPPESDVGVTSFSV